MIAYCGLDCDTCPILLATLEQDKSRQQALRETIAKECTEHYNMNLRPEEINDCDGCKATTGRLFSGCLDCKIRKCAILKKVESCAFCSEYICKKLKVFLQNDPTVENRLEEIRTANKNE